MRKRDGFTLIELLVVVGVIVLLLGITMPALAETRRVSKRTACLHNLVQVTTAIQNYLRANQDRFFYACRLPTARVVPPATALPSLPMVLKHELGGGGSGRTGFENGVFLCPADRVANTSMLASMPGRAYGPRYYDMEKTSYEWDDFLNGVYYRQRNLRVVADLVSVPANKLLVLSEYEAFHKRDGDPPDRPGTFNVVYADLQPRSVR